MVLLAFSLELWRMTFSHCSQSEWYLCPQASSSAARLFHTPVSQSATFDIELRALAYDLFTPSVSEYYFSRQASSSGARRFHTPLSQNAAFYLKLRALAHDFFTPLLVRTRLLSELCVALGGLLVLRDLEGWNPMMRQTCCHRR